MPMDKKIEELAAFLKSGSKIHIKKSQRGSFTRYCNGKVTSECIRRGKNSPDPKIRKKATFAANARKWKHADGGIVDPEGFEGIVTTNNRPYNKDYVSYINEALKQKGLNKEQRASILANIIEESGGDPYAKNPNGFYGLLQWANNRYAPTKERDPYKELDNQINYIISTKDNSTDKKSWTHGGTGSGFRSLLDAISAFKGSNLAKVMKGYTLGYVRPSGGLDAYRNRLKVAQQLYNLPGFTEGGNIGKYAKGKSLVYKPFTEQTENDELKYKPFIPDTIQDIVSDWTPQFPVEPVQTYTPVEQAPEQPKKETEQEVKTPEFELEQITAPRDATYVAKPNVSKYNKIDQSKFAKDLHSAYVSELTKHGIDPQYADWLTAQDALETRWGASTIGNYNFGNIQYNSKVHGNKYSFREATDHHKDGSAYSAKFLNFNSLDDYVRYKVSMLSNQNSSRYRDIFKGDINGFADRIQKSGYAESSNYAKALKDVITSVKRRLT